MISLSKKYDPSAASDVYKRQGLNLVRVIRQNFQVPRKLLKQTIQRLENGDFIEQEVRSVGSDRSVWYELKLKRFMLADQERTIVMARDISQRKRYEMELAHSRDLLNKTINAVPEPLSVKDSDLNVVLVLSHIHISEPTRLLSI